MTVCRTTRLWWGSGTERKHINRKELNNENTYHVVLL